MARAAMLAGAHVTVVTGPALHYPPDGVDVVRVETGLEMLKAMEAAFEHIDICIMAAAVADFRPSEKYAGKIRRGDSPSWNIELVANPDIAERLGSIKKGQFLACFSPWKPTTRLSVLVKK